MMKVMFDTAGDGLWSRIKTSVEVVDMKLGYVADDKDFGELCVYFNTATWDTRNGNDGLIYTDRRFLAELNVFLVEQGLTAVTYSEQGMQGDDYVSLDVGKDFLDSWSAKFGELTV